MFSFLCFVSDALHVFDNVRLALLADIPLPSQSKSFSLDSFMHDLANYAANQKRCTTDNSLAASAAPESVKNYSPHSSHRSHITSSINLCSKIDISASLLPSSARVRLRRCSYRKISDLTVNLHSCGFKIRLERIQFPNTNLFKVFNLSSLPTIDFFELRTETSGPFRKRAKKLSDFLWAPFSLSFASFYFPGDGLW